MSTETTSCFRLAAAGLALLLGTGLAGAAGPERREDPVSGIEFVRVAGGCFEMGANEVGGIAEEGQPVPPRADEMPSHEVCVDDFWIGRYEVTRAQWHRMMGEIPADRGGDSHPVTRVSWVRAQDFVSRLNAASDASHGVRGRFRLPTEAEWEYACRAGLREQLPRDNTPELIEYLTVRAWYREPLRDDPTTAPVGRMTANAWGLHDMLGNVAEWVEDAYAADGYRRHARGNPVVKDGSDRRVLRGGSYKSDWWNVRCGARNFGIADDGLASAGLRIVRDERAAGRAAR